jgi:hypothetical protein
MESTNKEVMKVIASVTTKPITAKFVTPSISRLDTYSVADVISFLFCRVGFASVLLLFVLNHYQIITISLSSCG